MIHGFHCRTKTFPSSCKYCQRRIFFFSCYCGSRVLFDDLGPPWPVHDCRSQSRGAALHVPSSINTSSRVHLYRGGPGGSDLLPGWQRGGDSIDLAIVARVSESQSVTREIMRIEPHGSINAEIVGIVRERLQPDLANRYGLARNSIGFIDLADTIGDADPVQLTVLVDELSDDPAAIDFSAYTFLMPQNLDAPGIRRNAIIRARLTPVVALNGIRLWLAREIELLH